VLLLMLIAFAIIGRLTNIHENKTAQLLQSYAVIGFKTE
jgi:hypothetical protein